MLRLAWISKQTATASLYGINWLAFITETGSVYSVVRGETLRTIQVTLLQWKVFLLFLYDVWNTLSLTSVWHTYCSVRKNFLFYLHSIINYSLISRIYVFLSNLPLELGFESALPRTFLWILGLKYEYIYKLNATNFINTEFQYSAKFG
jgi:hypothetical protein